MRLCKAAIILSLFFVLSSIVLVSMNVRVAGNPCGNHCGGGGGSPGAGGAKSGDKTHAQTRVVQVQVIVVVEVISHVTNVNPVLEVVTVAYQAPIISQSTGDGSGLITLGVSGIGMTSIAILLIIAAVDRRITDYRPLTSKGRLHVQQAKDMQKNTLETYQKMEKKRTDAEEEIVEKLRE